MTNLEETFTERVCDERIGFVEATRCYRDVMIPSCFRLLNDELAKRRRVNLSLLSLAFLLNNFWIDCLWGHWGVFFHKFAVSLFPFLSMNCRRSLLLRSACSRLQLREEQEHQWEAGQRARNRDQNEDDATCGHIPSCPFSWTPHADSSNVALAKLRQRNG